MHNQLVLHKIRIKVNTANAYCSVALHIVCNYLLFLHWNDKRYSWIYVFWHLQWERKNDISRKLRGVIVARQPSKGIFASIEVAEGKNKPRKQSTTSNLMIYDKIEEETLHLIFCLFTHKL